MVEPPATTGPRAPRRSLLRRLVLALAGMLVLAAGVAGVVLYQVNARMTTPYKAFTEPVVFVELQPGTSVNAIGRALADAGVVPDANTFRLAVWKLGAGRALKAGEYAFSEAASPESVVARLVKGDVVLRSITFREGLTLREMAELYESRGFGQARAFVDAASNATLIRDLDPDARDLEGYLFPETYALPRRATAADLVRMMVAQFRGVHASLLPDEAARESAKPLRTVMTLASLVEKETAVDAERSVVAAVYANRLRIGMPLQCDPTVIYALVESGQWHGNLTKSNLQVDSPYNTYRYPGLPPGPIANPGKAAIAAALKPADVGYLFFVSRNDGTHVFATTLAEHNRNVQQFQVQYFRTKRARERAGAAESRTR